MSVTFSPRRFWLQWVAANSLAELIGLGTVALMGFLALRHLGEPHGPAQTLGVAAAFVVLGALEGAVVGIAQSRVLRTCLPPLRGWVRSTVIGAMVTWAIGMAPSTFLSLGEASSSAQVEPPALPVVLLLAAGLGAFAGPVLAFFQWRELRKVLDRGAALWLPANGVAWALGMPVIFLGAQANEVTSDASTVAALVALSLLVAGGIVGAVHGRVLLWLVQHQARP
jgi:hypothetical protein